MAKSVLAWHFDIDRYLNPFLPRSPVHKLPDPISHFLGHRKRPQRPLGNIIIIFWTFIGIFCCISLIEVIGHEIPSFQEHGAPTIIGSFGAAAVLEFYAIEAPLAQPRNAVAGQLFASIVGVSVGKLFALSSDFESIRWTAAALSCASATAIMALTGTVHPPAGATALIAVVDDDVMRMGWYLIPVILLGCAIMQVVALLVNNIQRRFPNYWWTPEAVGEYWRKPGEGVPETESVSKFTATHSDADVEASIKHFEERKIVITRGSVTAPDVMYLRPEERMLLESISQRL